MTNSSPGSAPLSSETSAGFSHKYSFEHSKQAQVNSPIILAEDIKGKAQIDDPVWKVLPVALRNCKITEDWRNYDMIICHEDNGRSYNDIQIVIVIHMVKSCIWPMMTGLDEFCRGFEKKIRTRFSC